MRASHLRLLATIANSGGSTTVAALVRLHPGKPGTARASVSRSLRRMWVDGLVQLFTANGEPVPRTTSRYEHSVKRVAVTERGGQAAGDHSTVVNTRVELVTATTRPDASADARVTGIADGGIA